MRYVVTNPLEVHQKRYYYTLYADETILHPSPIDDIIRLIRDLFSDICQEYYEFIKQMLALNEYWQDSTSVYQTIETSLLGLKEILGFVFPRPGEVVDYLVQNPGLYDVVMYACSMTVEEFGGTSEIVLDIFHDSESGDRYLTLYVRQERYEDNIIEKMDRICDRYEPSLKGLSGWLLLTTDYKPPSV
jgi:hypothetical protein